MPEKAAEASADWWDHPGEFAAQQQRQVAGVLHLHGVCCRTAPRRCRGRAVPPGSVTVPRCRARSPQTTSILLGELTPGSRLPDESVLAEQLGVGRSTVREALRVLSGRGWIHTVRGPSGGVFVSQPDPQVMGRDLGDNLAFLVSGAGVSFAEVLEARQIHEAAAVRLAARRAGPADVERIRGLAEAARHLVDDPVRFNRVNVDFHLAVSEAARNRILTLWMRAMRQVLEGVMGAAARTRERRAHVAEQHAAITLGDADAAAAAMGTHLDDCEADYLEIAGRRIGS